MPKQGTNRGNAGKGRPKGSPNKITTAVRDALARSFEEVGGWQWLVKLAKENPKAYATLLAKCLPHEVVGEGGGPIQFQKIERRVVDPAGNRQTDE